ncbi:MAG: 30S ribosomal protein S7 [Chlamydiia bacterium]|nr:30S ribosomal protein S7 [Chlamydiia bacterium]
MSRRKTNKNVKRIINPDFVHGSVLVQKMINKVMKDGKKSKAQKIVYTALSNIQEKTGNCLEVVEKAKENARPKVELKSTRLGGTSISIPINVTGTRSESIFLMWLANILKKHKTGRRSHVTLEALLMDASKGQGALIKKREDTHKMAEANRAYSNQYRN